MIRWRVLESGRRSGSALLAGYFFTEVASTWLRAGNARLAEIELDKAFGIAKRTGEGYYSAEMHRLRAEIKWGQTKHFADAEPDLIKALDIATAQKSLTFQLRAATSLLRLSQARKDIAPTEKKRLTARHKDLLARVVRASSTASQITSICERLVDCLPVNPEDDRTRPCPDGPGPHRRSSRGPRCDRAELRS